MHFKSLQFTAVQLCTFIFLWEGQICLKRSALKSNNTRTLRNIVFLTAMLSVGTLCPSPYHVKYTEMRCLFPFKLHHFLQASLLMRWKMTRSEYDTHYRTQSGSSRTLFSFPSRNMCRVLNIHLWLYFWRTMDRWSRRWLSCSQTKHVPTLFFSRWQRLRPLHSTEDRSVCCPLWRLSLVFTSNMNWWKSWIDISRVPFLRSTLAVMSWNRSVRLWWRFSGVASVIMLWTPQPAASRGAREQSWWIINR